MTDNKNNKIADFFIDGNRLRKINIDVGDYRIRVSKGYRGTVRNDFTVILYAKKYPEFLEGIKQNIENISKLPKLRRSKTRQCKISYKRLDKWLNVAQVVIFVADITAYEKDDEDDSGIITKSFVLGDILAPRDRFYVTRTRLKSFILLLADVLSSANDTYAAMKKGGAITENLVVWDAFYFHIYLAAQAKIPFISMFDALENSQDHIDLKNLDRDSVEKFYKLVSLRLG